MSGMPLLDICIGLIFLYLLLSLICTAINEFIELLLKHRAVDLFEGIHYMLTGDRLKNGIRPGSFTYQFFMHPAIKGISPSRSTFKAPEKGKGEIAASATTDAHGIPWKHLWSRRQLPSYIPARQFAITMIDLLRKDGGSVADIFDVDRIPSEHLREALRPLVTMADNNVDRLRLEIESWYNGTMDRVSGLYKRHTQRILLLIGFVVAVGLNADSIRIGRVLASDAAVRAAVTATTARVVESVELQDSTGGLRQPDYEWIRRNIESVNAIGVPLGWRSLEEMKPESAGEFFSRLAGWLVTMFAISLGAPFWFDMLNKVMVLRATVKPHEKSREERSEDRRR